jgi:nucleoside-diphosphate-sugar epimerase
MVHVVVGTGPIGTTLAGLLAREGHDVVVVSRSAPATPLADGVRHEAADVTAPGVLAALARGAEVLYDCAAPPYHRWPTAWPPLHAAFLDAAEASGAVLVTASNLYGHGPVRGPMREDTPLASTEPKGRVRADMWRSALARHEAGRIRATEVRAADYFGPLAGRNTHYGVRLLDPLLAGRTLRPIGDPDTPHAVVFLPDFARALAAAGTTPGAWGRAWLAPHHPAETFRQVVGRLARAAGVEIPRIAPAPRAVLALGGVVSPMLREVARMRYQFTAPFVVDSSLSERALGLSPTPWDEAVGATVAWWRDRAARSDAVGSR